MTNSTETIKLNDAAMLPNMRSASFMHYIMLHDFERIDDKLLQKNNEYYCVINIYMCFLKELINRGRFNIIATPICISKTNLNK
tara:strand:+ start:81 stop:332 length:252 start_codon:yes stop_codon:yes gene_type:complete